MKKLNRERQVIFFSANPNGIKNCIACNVHHICDDNPEFNQYVLKMKELTRLDEVKKLLDGEIILGSPPGSYRLFLEIMDHYENEWTIDESVSYIEYKIYSNKTYKQYYN